ncbi:MAG TPA: cohesin domain-containing protein [Clostridiaceae bacterium]|jgi:hypothetical protein|nr:cohesin domain-containing protein [Clostridiaceae bacterium]
MKKKNFLIVLSMIMLSLILFGSVVEADKKQSVNLSISVNSTAVKKGDEVELSISGKNIQSNDIYAISGILEYDKNVLEIIRDEREENIAKTEVDSNWVSGIVLIQDSKISAITTNPNDGKIMKIKFKVLKNVESTEVKLNNIIAQNSKDEDITVNSESLKLQGRENINVKILIVAVVIILIIVIVVIIILKRRK